MKFVCGHCKEVIHDAQGSTMAFPGWQQHEACGYETYFDKFIADVKNPEKQPVPLETRRFRDETAEEVEARLKKQSEPSAADLDAVAAEQQVKCATALVQDFANHKTYESLDAQKAVEEYLNPPR